MGHYCDQTTRRFAICAQDDVQYTPNEELPHNTLSSSSLDILTNTFNPANKIRIDPLQQRTVSCFSKGRKVKNLRLTAD